MLVGLPEGVTGDEKLKMFVCKYKSEKLIVKKDGSGPLCKRDCRSHNF